MIFNSYEDKLNHLESFGIKEGDKVVVVAECEIKGKKGIVKQIRLGFDGGALYNIRFCDGYGEVTKNRFTRKSIELVSN